MAKKFVKRAWKMHFFQIAPWWVCSWTIIQLTSRKSMPWETKELKKYVHKVRLTFFNYKSRQKSFHRSFRKIPNLLVHCCKILRKFNFTCLIVYTWIKVAFVQKVLMALSFPQMHEPFTFQSLKFEFWWQNLHRNWGCIQIW